MDLNTISVTANINSLLSSALTNQQSILASKYNASVAMLNAKGAGITPTAYANSQFAGLPAFMITKFFSYFQQRTINDSINNINFITQLQAFASLGNVTLSYSDWAFISTLATESLANTSTLQQINTEP